MTGPNWKILNESVSFKCFMAKCLHVIKNSVHGSAIDSSPLIIESVLDSDQASAYAECPVKPVFEPNVSLGNEIASLGIRRTGAGYMAIGPPLNLCLVGRFSTCDTFKESQAQSSHLFLRLLCDPLLQSLNITATVQDILFICRFNRAPAQVFA
jgi:hypothetical protein